MNINFIKNSPLARKLYGALSSIERGQAKATLAAIHSALGSRAAIWYFQKSPFLRRTPARRDWLRAKVVSKMGDEGPHFWALNMLLANPGAREFLDYLALETSGKTIASFSQALPLLMSSVERNPETGIMVIKTLVEQGRIELARSVFEKVQRTNRIGKGALLRAFSALCPRPLDSHELESLGELTFEATFPRVCNHRLLVLSEPLPVTIIKHLAHGAEELTIILFQDLYGKLELKELHHLLPGVSIHVEHARTRADRFEQRYYDLHKKTSDCARTLLESSSGLLSEFVDDQVELPALVPLLQLEVADKLFFSAIRANAVIDAAKDEKFDDVIISFNHDFRLFRLVCTNEGIVGDRRIKGCCWAADKKTREQYLRKLQAAREYAEKLNSPLEQKIQDEDKVLENKARVKKYLKSAKATKRTLSSPKSGRPSIVLFATQDRAYISDITKIAYGLGSQYDVDIFWGIPRLDYITKALQAGNAGAARSDSVRRRAPGIVSMPNATPTLDARRAFDKLLIPHVQSTGRALRESFRDDHALVSSMLLEFDASIGVVLLTALGRIRAGLNALNKYEYRAALICSARTSVNIQHAVSSRAAGIPSFAVEPHCLNASYCRYATIPTDYAVVFSDYFAGEYDRYFGIGRDRVFPLGSPRFLRPEGYEPNAARMAARNLLGLRPGDPDIIFLAMQPLPDKHVSDGVRRVLRAARAVRRPIKVLLRPHPEEGHSRINMYREIIVQEEAEDICELALEGEFKTMLMACSMALVFYSVTAVEAAIHERPISVVGFERENYPVPYSEILGVPYCLSVEEITAAVEDALEHGLTSRSGASLFHDQNPHLFENRYFERLGHVIAGTIANESFMSRPLKDLPQTPFVTAPFQPFFSERNT